MRGAIVSTPIRYDTIRYDRNWPILSRYFCGPSFSCPANSATPNSNDDISEDDDDDDVDDDDINGGQLTSVSPSDSPSCK